MRCLASTTALWCVARGESYIRTLELIAEGEARAMTKQEKDQFQAFDENLQAQMDGYKSPFSITQTATVLRF